MIKVVAKSIIKEDRIEDYENCAVKLINETRKEKGCIAYQLFQDKRNKKVLTFIEEWESQEALDSHMKSRHFREIVPKLAEYQEKESELNIYTLVL